MKLSTLDHVVTDACVAYQDPEGFWQIGRPLTDTEIEALNNKTRDRLTRVIRRNPDGRWLITTGMGNHYAADVAKTCQRCGSTLWIDESAGVYQPWHHGCYDPADV